MNILELFAGSKSFSTAALSLGHTTFTSDYDPDFDTDYTADILAFDTAKVPFQPDIIWASPPCESFSVASIGHHWNVDNTPKTDNAIHGMAMVEKTIAIIEELKPTWYFIENPRGKLRKLPFMQIQETPRYGELLVPSRWTGQSYHLYRHTVTYCQYGDTRMKPTDIWTNCPYWTPRPMCKNGAPCHVSAPRGSSTGTQGIKTYYDRSRIPQQLCLEILQAIQAAELPEPTGQLTLELA